jgi:hypothetical protein
MLQIVARRRNARRFATGPRTKEGRHRVSLNRRQLELPKAVLRNFERLRGDPRDFQRVWRDVLAIFSFMGPQMEPRLGAVAWDLWLKQHCLRCGEAAAVLEGIDARLEKNLVDLVRAYQVTNRKWKCCLAREFGPFFPGKLQHFRMAVELRLRSTQQLVREGKLPPDSESALVAAVREASEILLEAGERELRDIEEREFRDIESELRELERELEVIFKTNGVTRVAAGDYGEKGA